MNESLFIGRDDLKDRLIGKYPDIDFTVVEAGGVWQLDRIVAARRGRGRGTAFMNELCSLADAADKKIVLTPDLSFGASSLNRLARFYRSFGFVKNAGRRRDYAVSHSMLRLPNPN